MNHLEIFGNKLELNPQGFKLSISAYQNLICTLEETMNKETLDTASKETGDYKVRWTGSKSLPEAVELLKTGTPTEEHVFASVEKLLPKFNAQMKPTSFSFQEEGAMVDVGTFCSGEPAHWLDLDYKLVRKQGKVIWLMINCGARSDIDPKSIVNRGIALISVTKALMASGYKVGVEIVKTFTSDNGRYKNEINIVLKQPEQPLAFNLLYFCLVHPSFNRRIIFRLCELLGEHFPVYVGDGYGITTDQNYASSQKWAIPSVCLGTSNYSSIESATTYFCSLIASNLK